MQVYRVVLLGAMLAVIACAGREPPPGQVTIHGMVYSDHLVDLSCEDQASRETRPEELSGVVLTFRDPAGEPLGATTTGPLEWEDLAHGCRFLARYRVALPRAEAYRVEFRPPAPRHLNGSSYQGAELLEPRSITRSELERQGHRWDFEALPTYVTP